MIVCENGGDSARGEGENALYVRSLETGEERIFPLKTWAIGPRWTPDGRFIYFSDARRGFMLCLELATSLITDVQCGQASPNYFIDISPDGRSIYYVHYSAMGAGEEFRQLIKRDIKTGLESELYRMNVRLPIIVSLSPDGERLAVVSREEQRAIQIVPSSGGPARDIYRFKHSGGHPTWLDWTPDGQSIIFTKRNEKHEGPGWGLWRVSVDGGEPESLGTSTRHYIEEVCVHPDGKRVALSTSTSGGPELWVMENFLPGDKAGAKGGNK